MHWPFAVVAGYLLLPSVCAFYLPGAAPRDYRRDEQVDLFVNALTPMLGGKDSNGKLVSVAGSSASYSEIETMLAEILD